MSINIPRLGVNIDHVATLRQARGVTYPSPVDAAVICQQAGAEGITLHLREDRRHIQDADVPAIKERISIPMNLEMAATGEMLEIAREIKPEWVCLVPEKRQELTTEGGLDVLGQEPWIEEVVTSLQEVGTKVSLFIDADTTQIDAAIRTNANAIEIHTGAYAEATLENNAAETNEENTIAEKVNTELERIKTAVQHAHKKNHELLVNAGHGLTRDNVAAIANIEGIYELNIGHALIADAVFMGLSNAVVAMKEAMRD